MPRSKDSRNVNKAKEKKRAAARDMFAKSLRQFQQSLLEKVDKKLQDFKQEHVTPAAVQRRLEVLELKVSNMVKC